MRVRRIATIALLLGACEGPSPRTVREAGEDPSIPKAVPAGSLAAPEARPEPPGPAPEPRGLVGPSGALGVEVYRRRRRALMDKVGGGAVRVTPEKQWGDAREGVGEPWEGERAPIPSKALEVATGIARLFRARGLAAGLLAACDRYESL